jgi:hypothetical protein
VIKVRPLLIPDGWLARWLDYCDPFEVPDSFALWSVLAVASAAINRRVRVNRGYKPCVFPNLFVLMLGPPASKKSDALDAAVELLAEAVPDTPMLPDDFSMSAAIGELAERSAQTQKGSGLIVAHELSDLLGGSEYRQENTRALTKLWDCPNVYTRKTRLHGNETIQNAYVTVAGASAPDWMEEIDPKTLAGGFLRRLLCVCENGPKRGAARPKVQEEVKEALIRVMRERFGTFAFGGVEMKLDDRAAELNDTWYMEKIVKLRGQFGERESGFINTMQAHAMKVAAVAHIAEGLNPEELDAPSLELGQKLVEQLVPGTFALYSSLTGTPFARLRASILRTVRSSGGGMEAKQLSRVVRQSTGVKPDELNSALISLIDDRELFNEGGVIRVK